MQRNTEEIRLFFDEVFCRIIFPEIERCIKDDSQYVAALALLSYTEYIGGLITGNLGLKNKGKESFAEALKYFPDEYSDLDSSLQVKYEYEKDKTTIDRGIYSIFRCGMAHECLVKGVTTAVFNNRDGQACTHRIGIGTIQGPGVINLITRPPADSNNMILAFRTNEYYRDFKLAIEKIFKKLAIDCDQQMLIAFNCSLDRIYSRRII